MKGHAPLFEGSLEIKWGVPVSGHPYIKGAPRVRAPLILRKDTFICKGLPGARANLYERGAPVEGDICMKGCPCVRAPSYERVALVWGILMQKVQHPGSGHYKMKWVFV